MEKICNIPYYKGPGKVVHSAQLSSIFRQVYRVLRQFLGDVSVFLHHEISSLVLCTKVLKLLTIFDTSYYES